MIVLAAMLGGMPTFLWLVVEMEQNFKGRLKELNEQEERFWNLSHRAPDYYAREIALRLARLFARETGQRPTVGTSGVDGKPSTGYARALSAAYDVLGITAAPRSPAEWAVAQVTDNDLSPPRNALAGFLGYGLPMGAPARRNVLADLASTKKRSSD